jgi:hypothetical protein
MIIKIKGLYVSEINQNPFEKQLKSIQQESAVFNKQCITKF